MDSERKLRLGALLAPQKLSSRLVRLTVTSYPLDREQGRVLASAGEISANEAVRRLGHLNCLCAGLAIVGGRFTDPKSRSRVMSTQTPDRALHNRPETQDVRYPLTGWQKQARLKHNPALQMKVYSTAHLSGQEACDLQGLDGYDTVDAEHLRACRTLILKRAGITRLNTEMLAGLNELDVSETMLSALDLAFLQRLEVLDVSCSRIKALDVSTLTRLRSLRACEVAQLALGRLALLKELDVRGSGLTEIDISHFPALEKLFCANSAFARIGASAGYRCGQLRILGAAKTRISLLESNLIANLTAMDLSDSAIVTIELARCRALETLKIARTIVAYLNLYPCCRLRTLDCSGTALRHIHLRHCPELSSLNISWTAIAALDLSSCRLGLGVDVSGTRISHLGALLGHCASISFQRTPVKHIDCRDSIGLISVRCGTYSTLEADSKVHIRRVPLYL